MSKRRYILRLRISWMRWIPLWWTVGGPAPWSSRAVLVAIVLIFSVRVLCERVCLEASQSKSARTSGLVKLPSRHLPPYVSARERPLATLLLWSTYFCEKPSLRGRHTLHACNPHVADARDVHVGVNLAEAGPPPGVFVRHAACVEALMVPLGWPASAHCQSTNSTAPSVGELS